ncbi:MAG: M1 family metallopeptidase, partial [Bacteroidota bacterium]
MNAIAISGWLSWPSVLIAVILMGGCASARVGDIPAGTFPSSVPDTLVGEQPTEEAIYTVLGQQADEFQARERLYDIFHTTLDLRFDFENQTLHGVASHRLMPLAAGTDSLHFDAADMDIHYVTLTHDEWTDTLMFRHREDALAAFPIEALSPADTVDVAIAYTAHPLRSQQVRGLHFVDGPDVDPSLPTQVWTLSQPEDGRYWFPTWDYPNDFMSFTIRMTVPERFDTYANGDLIGQRSRSGMRTDTWHLAQPQVSYLAAFAVGEFAAVADTFFRADSSYVPLEYIVEPEFEEFAMLNFGETRRMLQVFEHQFGLRYPWSNYKQVAVREFTAGGMEHTTLSTMSSALQVDDRAVLDYTGRNLIAHELAHQWLGNLLTSENWAHLALNEGFAQYFEEVYLEEAYGPDHAQELAITNLEAYLAEAQTIRRPIIWYGYDDPYEVYDRHTYNKAARVLNQLRFEVGEDAWWHGIQGYVRDNRHQNVDATDLQRSMEEASGRSLEGFFRQWFHSPGHPELLVEQGPARETGLYEIRIQQVQDTSAVPVFEFDVEFEVYYRYRQPYRGRVRIASADTTIRIGTAGEVGYV